jgi:hypothetical protein
VHIPLLAFSYAFSLWMLIDAYRRNADQFWYVIILVPLGEWAYFFLVKIRDYEGLFRSGPALKCQNCRHCEKIYDDGVKCSIDGKSVFKTAVHTANCMNHRAK